MFFTFRQNNSGGYYEEDDVATYYVIIEADYYEIANQIAEDKGLFSYKWCECCGERFSRMFDDTDGTESPMIWDNHIDEYKYKPSWTSGDDVFARVFYKDGSVKNYEETKS